MATDSALLALAALGFYAVNQKSRTTNNALQQGAGVAAGIASAFGGSSKGAPAPSNTSGIPGYGAGEDFVGPPSPPGSDSFTGPPAPSTSSPDETDPSDSGAGDFTLLPEDDG